MRQCLFSVLVLVATSTGIEASCVDPSTLVRSTVNITRDFGEDERAEPGVLGIRGTGWFLSPRLIVTAAHVAEAMRLSPQDWKEIAIKERDRQASIAGRLLRVAGSQPEKIAVVELKTAFAGATVLQSRMGALVPEERLVSLAYPVGSGLRFAGGRFVRYGDDDGFAGMALLEMHDGNDRLVLDHGASGAPVLDCDGRVVAVVSTIITQIVNLPGPLRVSTAWQTPNVISIPIEVLKDFSWSE